MSPYPLPDELREFANVLERAGHECYLVGGATRNMMLGLPSGDFDIATDAKPEEVQRLFRRVIPTGIQHGTVTVLYESHSIEVTTFRHDFEYADQRHPDGVVFVSSIEEDLQRRDFTMNAIAVRCVDGEVIDPTGGRRDIETKTIRAIGNPDDRFGEDALRLLRACRFAAQLGFEVEPRTRSAMRAHFRTLSSVSGERIRDETMKILESKKPSIGFRMMADTNILGVVFPEIDDAQQNHDEAEGFGVFEHMLNACDASPRNKPAVRLAALLHEIGQPESVSTDRTSRDSISGSGLTSAQLAVPILRRLKNSRALERYVVLLIRHNSAGLGSEWSDARIRHLLHELGPGNIDGLIDLRVADESAVSNRSDISRLHEEMMVLRSRVRRIERSGAPLSIRELAVDGHLLANKARIPRNAQMGLVTRFLLDAVLDDPSLNTKERLLQLALEYSEANDPKPVDLRKPPREARQNGGGR